VLSLEVGSYGRALSRCVLRGALRALSGWVLRGASWVLLGWVLRGLYRGGVLGSGPSVSSTGAGFPSKRVLRRAPSGWRALSGGFFGGWGPGEMRLSLGWSLRAAHRRARSGAERACPFGPVLSRSGAVVGAGDRAHRRQDDVRVHARAPHRLPVDHALHVGRRLRQMPGREGVLGVVQHLDLHAHRGQGVGERRERAVAGPRD